MNFPKGVLLEVPEFFTPAETADALEAFEVAIEVPVIDSGARRSLSSLEPAQAIQLTLHLMGKVAVGVLARASWAGIVKLYEDFRKRYEGRPISIELVAEDDEGHRAEYFLADLNDKALRDIPRDLTREVSGTRTKYDVEEGWLTWEEANNKRRRSQG